MSSWKWNGARWWKFDLHTHTPASDDYGKGTEQAALKQRKPKEWLLDYMRAGIDAVAITDHNSGAWIDELDRALRELVAEEPDGYRPICLFPGVEISVNGGVHLLAILASHRTTSDVDSLLGAVRFEGRKGSCDKATSVSFGEVVAEIERAGGIAIPAHVDLESGLFRLKGTTLTMAFECSEIFAMEVVDPATAKPAAYSERKLHWTEILGSDAHHPTGDAGRQYPGSQFTWIKMGSPSLEGLRLALLDGSLSVRRSDKETGDPNQHASLVLEEIEVAHTQFMGRGSRFRLPLNPWLNAIVGGRGTGKSSLVEFLRLGLRREDELPESLKEEFEKYALVSAGREDGGLLTDEATVRVIYRKNGSRFRIQWSPGGDLDAIEESVDGDWGRAEGDISQRFPIRIYSQKQVFQLAKAPLALLGVVDDAPEVDRRSWSDRWNEEESRFLSVRARAREVEAGLLEELRLKGELDDVKRKLTIFEDAGHADGLKTFQRRRRQRRAVETWEEEWSEDGERLRQIARELVPSPLDDTALDKESAEDEELSRCAKDTRDRLAVVREAIEGLATQADAILAEWQEARDSLSWKKAADAAEQAYDALRERLADEEAGDPSAYGELVQRRQTIEQRLKDLEDRKRQVESLLSQAAESWTRLLEMRRELTVLRRTFLADVLQDNRYVRIDVDPYGARETVKAELRELLQREGGGFEKDIGEADGGGLLGEIYGGDGSPGEIEAALVRIKEKVRDIAAGSYDPAELGDQRFATHIAKLRPEALDRLDLWFPEDSLDVRYSPTGDGRDLRSIQEGSPGQKSAALLAFLLSYGAEPLVLDQPEDDLDNQVIHDLIVTQLREVKRRRQIIVVSRDPNIVVNGDAELVVAFAARGGETQKDCEGSLQEKKVRDTICAVLEGGREAFEQRYRRIALEGRRA